MEKSFACSLIHKGVLGGGIYLDNQNLTYKTNKLTANKKFRNLVLSLNDIDSVSWKWIIATFSMKNGERYKFMIFNKNRFNKIYNEFKKV